VACLGEVMVELSRLDLAGGTARVGVAGDTYNMAVYLARLLGEGVSYVTVLGRDALSDRMVEVMAAEGVGTDLVGRHPTRLPGLYAIELDAGGERSFRYWREASAARTLFGEAGPSLDDLGAFDVVLLSGITLAILPEEVRAALVARLGALRAAGRVIAFDGNYRPRLWPDVDAARGAFEAMWRATTVALPSLDDEAALRPGATPATVAQRLAGLGVPEVVVKTGAGGPLIGPDARPLGLAAAAHVVDTSGAGDSFDAGYLAARLGGADPEAAARAGHRLATAVIGHHGAVIPRAAMPAH
jgi:2-dehydro-3-deoxygluconokinase